MRRGGLTLPLEVDTARAQPRDAAGTIAGTMIAETSRMRPVLLALLVCVGCQGSDPPPPPDGNDDDPSGIDPELAAALQSALDDAREAEGALGAAVAITVPDQGVWLGASGLVAPGGRALTVEDPYPIGSITKVFTAIVILQLVEEGQLALEDPLSRWYPSFPRAAEIRVEHLLEHTSGIVDYLADPGADITQPVEPEAMLEYPAAQGLQFDPGARWDYSNTNYVLLGLIAEEAGGTTYASLVRTRVIEPLALGGTFLDGEEPGPDFVLGYSRENGEYVEYPHEHPSWAWAAGAIVSTLPDQIRFFEGLLGGELLDAATLDRMKEGVQIPEAPAGTTYGLGLESGDTEWGRFYTHGGLIHLVMSATGGIPDSGLTGAAYANTVQSNPYAILFAAVETVAP